MTGFIIALSDSPAGGAGGPRNAGIQQMVSTPSLKSMRAFGNFSGRSTWAASFFFVDWFYFCFGLHIHNWMLFHTSFNTPLNIFPSFHGYWLNKVSSCPSLGLFFSFSYGLFSNCLSCEITDLSYFTAYIDILLNW